MHRQLQRQTRKAQFVWGSHKTKIYNIFVHIHKLSNKLYFMKNGSNWLSVLFNMYEFDYLRHLHLAERQDDERKQINEHYELTGRFYEIG